MSSGSALGLVLAREDLLRGICSSSSFRCDVLALSVVRNVLVDGWGLYSSSPSLSTTLQDSLSWGFCRDRAGVRSLTIFSSSRLLLQAEELSTCITQEQKQASKLYGGLQRYQGI